MLGGKQIANDKELITALVESENFSVNACRLAFNTSTRAKTIAAKDQSSIAASIPSKQRRRSKTHSLRSRGSQGSVSSAITNFTIAGVVVVASAVACAPGSDCLDGKPCTSSPSSPNAGGADADVASGPACTVVGRPHIGLGGEDLVAKTDGPLDGDRARAKPYTALVTEYTRVLGTVNRPALIDEAGGTFGIPSDRWYLEPLASAVFVNTAFNVAFDGCLKMTGDASGGSADPRSRPSRPPTRPRSFAPIGRADSGVAKPRPNSSTPASPRRSRRRPRRMGVRRWTRRPARRRRSAAGLMRAPASSRPLVS